MGKVREEDATQRKNITEIQARNIMILQDRINLMNFEIMQLNREKAILKSKLASKNKFLSKLKKELKNIRDNKKYDNLSDLIYSFKTIQNDEDDDCEARK